MTRPPSQFNFISEYHYTEQQIGTGPLFPCNRIEMGQRNKKRTARSMGIVCSCLIVLITSTNVLADDQTLSDPYYNLIYDFEVAQFCGLVNKHTHDAFWAKRKAIEKKSQRTIEQLRKTRIGAMAAADIEYANRGLGGYKPWCQNEGRAGVDRVLSSGP